MGTIIEPFKEEAKFTGKCVLHVKCYGVYKFCNHIKSTIDYIL